MKCFKKRFTLLGVALLSAMLLTGCGGKKEKASKDNQNEGATNAYTYVYSTDPTMLDYTATSKSSNTRHTVNFIDGLMQFDKYGNVIPATAEDWEVSKDGLTYTYHIRKGVKWVDSQGNEKGEVKAQDFVTGLKHAVEAQSETLYIVSDSIVGLDDYMKGKITDFDKVGVKAVDDNTLTYTLKQAEPYWNSKTTYGILFPINEEFLKEKGSEFGSTTPDSILYNGAYLLTNFTSKTIVEYAKNDAYWDADNVFIDTVKMTYSDGSDPDSYFRGFDEGQYTMAGVYPNSPAYKEVEAKYKDNIIWSQPDRSTYNFTFNFNRQVYNATSKTTDKAKEDTRKAILNDDFRKAIQFSFNKKAYLAQKVGEAGSAKALRNTWVPGDFVAIKGQPFGEYTEKYLKERDPEAFSDVSLKDGADAYYNPEKAKKFMEKAKEALQQENVEFPIHLDFPRMQTSEIFVNMGKSFKKTVEDSLGSENVVVDIQLLSEDAYNNATYLAANGSYSDFDIANASAWSADYSDPKTFLNVYQSQSGDMLHSLGLEAVLPGREDKGKAVKEALHLNEYDELLAKASAITDDLDARYEAYAKAEAWLLDKVIQMPAYADGGAPSLTRGSSFEVPYGISGATDNFKGMHVSDKPQTAKEHEENFKKWEKEKEASNKKYGEEVAKKFEEAK